MPTIVPTTKNILVVAGDSSGDLAAADLIKALKDKAPDIYVAALGGTRMQKVSDRFIYNIVAVGAAGFSEPVKHFFLWAKLIRLVRRFLEERHPACVIAVDFYGFNHQVLGLAAHRKIPAYYYISPQVWATRPGRVGSIARLVRHMMTILPFEEPIYKKTGVPCTFVGHPLLDILPEPVEPANRNGTGYVWKIGLLPGSRPDEISRHLPLFLNAFAGIKKIFPGAAAHVFAVPELSDQRIKVLAERAGAGLPAEAVTVVRENDYSMRSKMDFSFTSSGTATLENGLLGVPMVVAYKMPRLTHFIARKIIMVPWISLVNILSGREIVKEFVQESATPEALSGKALSLMMEPGRLESMRTELLSLRKLLGKPGVAIRAAGIILEGQPSLMQH
ncbi:MAG: lipid-A-disaccharide synthase [bacterium]